MNSAKDDVVDDLLAQPSPGMALNNIRPFRSRFRFAINVPYVVLEDAEEKYSSNSSTIALVRTDTNGLINGSLDLRDLAHLEYEEVLEAFLTWRKAALQISPGVFQCYMEGDRVVAPVELFNNDDSKRNFCNALYRRWRYEHSVVKMNEA